jgi:hypothetical protein
MTVSDDPARKYDALQTCSEILANLKPADQKMILAALIEQYGRPEQGRPPAARPGAARSYGRGKAWKG